MQTSETTALVARSAMPTTLDMAEQPMRDLAQTQASLRRLAMLVARGAPPEELFAAVSTEVLGHFGDGTARMIRFEFDGTATLVANEGAPDDLYVDQDVGSLNLTSTLAGYRSRGAQTALIATRIKTAAEAGCRWVVAETRVPDEGMSSAPLDDLKDSGLRPRYVGQNCVWRSPAAINDLIRMRIAERRSSAAALAGDGEP